MRLSILILGAAGMLAWPRQASAAADSVAVQAPAPTADSLEWLAYGEPNGEMETYLRYLQIAGDVPLYPWTARGFSPSELRRLSVGRQAHPWTGRPAFVDRQRTASPLRARLELRANSSFPYGTNDGPVWAGRGLTASITAGASFRAGPFSAELAPMAFIAQNGGFELLDNGETGNLRFADALYGGGVDKPQRFGEDPYGRLDFGNSTVRAELRQIAIGVSTANLAWGPFERFPFLLGTNAPGIAHAFLGSARPLNFWIARIHGRVIWGRLEQSKYSPVEGEPTFISVTEPGTRRFATGFVFSVTPRGIPGLEIGLARFFHSPWPRSGLPRSYATKAFEGLLKVGLRGAPEFSDPGSGAENQLVAGFARWVFPRAGFEMYGEYGREDHSWDLRDFVQEPDHSRSYALGLRKVIASHATRVEGITFELINFQLPHLARSDRGEGSIYVHGVMRQGHTHHGQLLGADIAPGTGAGSVLRWDRQDRRGRTSVGLSRVVRGERGTFFRDGQVDPNSIHVQYSLEGEKARIFRSSELTGGLAVIRELNRNFGRDSWALSAVLRANFSLFGAL